MKIASILPYKENYTLKGAGAVALWISDFIKYSEYKRNTYIIGSTKNKNYLTKNYINIDNIIAYLKDFVNIFLLTLMILWLCGTILLS